MAIFSRTWLEGLKPQLEQSDLRMSFCPVTRASGHPPEHLFLWEIRVLNTWQGPPEYALFFYTAFHHLRKAATQH